LAAGRRPRRDTQIGRKLSGFLRIRSRCR